MHLLYKAHVLQYEYRSRICFRSLPTPPDLLRLAVLRLVVVDRTELATLMYYFLVIADTARACCAFRLFRGPNFAALMPTEPSSDTWCHLEGVPELPAPWSNTWSPCPSSCCSWVASAWVLAVGAFAASPIKQALATDRATHRLRPGQHHSKDYG